MSNKKRKELALQLVRPTPQDFLLSSEPISNKLYRKLQSEFIRLEQNQTYLEVLDKYPNTIPKSTETEALVRQRREILRIHGQDSLENLRRSLKLKEYRTELTENIANNISFENGLERLLRAANSNPQVKAKRDALGIKKARTIAHIGQIFPEISSAEIAWLSTVEAIPGVYLDDQNLGVPTIMDFTPQGIEFGFDGHNSRDLNDEHSKDPYITSGITGVTNRSYVVPFCPTFEIAFRNLALLTISDQEVYSQILEDHHEHSLLVGDGKLKRDSLRENHTIYGITTKEFESSRLKDLLDNPNNKFTTKSIDELEEHIHANLETKVVYDFGQKRFLSKRDLVKLTGLLSRVPNILQDDSNFNGYVMPYGKGVKIIDQNGNLVDAVTYDPHIQIALQENIHHKITDSSRTNEFLGFMFEAYAQRIEAEVPVHQDLPYDAVREKLRTKYGILTSPRSTNAIQEISDPFLLSFTKGKTKFKEYSLKIGLAESQFLLDQLDKLPRKLVPGIKRIKRYFDPISDFDLFLNGANTLGTFNGETLTLYSPKNMPFKAFDNTQSQIFCDVLQHELGHGIWNSLDEKLQSEWRSLTRAKNNLSSKNHIININNLRDIYSGRDINSPENKPKLGISIDQFKIEEFCWTFSAYVNHGEEFRTMSKASEVLQKKYDLIKRIINQYTTQEESLEYSTTPLATLKQLDMFRRNIIDSYSRNEAYMLAKKEHEQKEKESMEAREEVVESFEQRYENHGASIDAYTQYENSIDRPYDDDRYSLYVQLHTLMPSGIDYKPISPMESDHIFDILIDSVEETAKYMMQRFFFLDDRDDLIDHFESTRYWLIERATKREV